MNTLLSHSLIALSAGLIGALSSSLFSSEPENSLPIISTHETSSSPLSDQACETDDRQRQVYDLQQQIGVLESRVSELTAQQISRSTSGDSEGISSLSNSHRDNIINSGFNADATDEILRRLDEQKYRRLELQNEIRRADVSQRDEYIKELQELNKNKISLRSEMGDDAFDQYLFVSGQNNRVRVGLVMPDSSAESAGIQPNDIVLFYGNHKIINRTDVRTASAEGEAGNYVVVQVLRDGEEISLTVPRGELGVQFESVLLDPYLGH